MSNYFKNANTPDLMDRIVCAFSYITMGFLGVVWLIISFLTKNTPREFVMYHISQSVFLSLFLYILSLALGLVFDILRIVPFIGDFVYKFQLFFQTPIYFGFSIIYLAVLIIIIYGVLGSLMGRYTYIPLISDIINANMRR